MNGLELERRCEHTPPGLVTRHGAWRIVICSTYSPIGLLTVPMYTYIAPPRADAEEVELNALMY